MVLVSASDEFVVGVGTTVTIERPPIAHRTDETHVEIAHDEFGLEGIARHRRRMVHHFGDREELLGGAGLVMFGMVAATGIRILGGVDFRNNRFNALVVAISIGIGMIPLIAPNFKQWMPHSLHPLIESGILLASLSAVVLNLFFNGAQEDEAATIAATKQADSH